MSSGNNTLGPPEGAQGCPVAVGDAVCGESNSLDIMKEFNRLYQERMNQVDSEAEKDCSLEKIKLQEQWIRDLTQQNEMLVKAVQELEYEATERVQQLEGKLHKSAQSLCEVMKKYREHDFTADLLAEPLQKIGHFKDDLKNVLEFVRRVRENQNWNLDGLFFYNISEKDLLGTKCEYANKPSKHDSTTEGKATPHDQDSDFGDVGAMNKELNARREECESLKQDMADMRQALTEEVASKHDQIVLLKNELHLLEERCLQADKQTAFKEDIIRELRKEIKQLKQQVTEKYLNLVAEQLREYCEQGKSISQSRANAGPHEITKLTNFIKIKDDLLLEQLSLINNLVVRLFNADQGLEKLEKQTLAVTKMKQNCCSVVTDKDIRRFQESLNQVPKDEASKPNTTIEEPRLKTTISAHEQHQKEPRLLTRTVEDLELSQDKSEPAITIEQQKITINNLQQALVQIKHELDEVKRRNQDNASSWTSWFGFSSANDVVDNNNSVSSNKSVHDI